MNLHLLLAGVFAALAFCGCRSTKPSASIYEGNGPSIHYTSTEHAGGAVRSSHYR